MPGQVNIVIDNVPNDEIPNINGDREAVSKRDQNKVVDNSRNHNHEQGFLHAVEHLDLKCIKSFLVDPEKKPNLADKFTKERKTYTAIEYILNEIPQSEEFLKEILDKKITLDEKNNVKLNYRLFAPKEDSNKMKVLIALIKAFKNNDGSIFLHPLIQSYLHLIWSKLKYLYMGLVFLYALFVIFMSWIILRFYKSSPEPKIEWVTVLVGLIISLLILLEVMLFIVIMINRSFMMCLKRPIWILSLCSKIMMMVIIFVDKQANDQHVPKMIAATSALLSWLEIMNLISHFPECKSMYYMFTIVMKRAIKVFLCFGIYIIIGFSLAFWVIFYGTESFFNLPDTLIRTVVMTSEFDFVDLYKPLENDQHWHIVFKFVFVIFIFFVPIVMMNLITSLIISDMSKLEYEGMIENTKNQILLIDTLFVLKMITKKLKVFPISEYTMIKNSGDLPLKLEKQIFKMVSPLNLKSTV